MMLLPIVAVVCTTFAALTAIFLDALRDHARGVLARR
jgi:hypothetical protein